MDDAKNLAENLDRLMVRHRHTERDLARLAGVGKKTLFKLLNPGDLRSSPSLRAIGKVAGVYQLETWMLMSVWRVVEQSGESFYFLNINE